MPAWLEVQRSKSFFLLTLNDSVNDMKYFRNCLHHTSVVPQPFLLLLAANLAPSWMFGLKIELMVCDGLVGGTMEQSCLFPGLTR